jgi:hypothetical protein
MAFIFQVIWDMSINLVFLLLIRTCLTIFSIVVRKLEFKELEPFRTKT